MPTYHYRCKACLQEFEEVQRFSDDPLIKCPQCKKKKLVRLISGSGLVFKGSGFYLTDYKNKSTSGADSGSSAKKEAKDDSSNESKAGSKGDASESKGDAKSESKGESKSDSGSETKSSEKSSSKKKKSDKSSSS